MIKLNWGNGVALLMEPYHYNVIYMLTATGASIELILIRTCFCMG